MIVQRKRYSGFVTEAKSIKISEIKEERYFKNHKKIIGIN